MARQIILGQHERVVDVNRLNDLERKAAAHDGYLAASKRMSAARHEQMQLRMNGDHDQRLYSLGWLDGLYAFGEAVVVETAIILETRDMGREV